MFLSLSPGIRRIPMLLLLISVIAPATPSNSMGMLTFLWKSSLVFHSANVFVAVFPPPE